MEFQQVILEGFKGSEEALVGIKRYIHSITPVMFYRTNDLLTNQKEFLKKINYSQ